MKVLMVCLGNICRSPMAEGILQHMATENGLNWTVDSAGTSRWHLGEQPDRRAIQTCRNNGLDITYQRARQFTANDFDDFDLILTMDDSNYADVQRLTRDDSDRARIRRMMEFATNGQTIVPDPYYDGRFQDVFDLLQDVCSEVIRAYT